MTENRAKQIQLQWNMMNDEMRWKLLPELQLEFPKLIVNLDNDDTFVTHNDIDAELFMLEFDEFIGWSYGVHSLLKAFNIEAEPV